MTQGPLRKPQRPLWTAFLRPGSLLVVGFWWTVWRLAGQSPGVALVAAVLSTVLLVVIWGDTDG